MKSKLIYVEKKSGESGRGPAWISLMNASKSGATIYSNGLAFKRIKGGGVSANYYEMETGDEYWISGVKKNNQDRHWAGGGNVLIDHSAISAYLKETNVSSLPSNLIPSQLDEARQKDRHVEIEHQSLNNKLTQF